MNSSQMTYAGVGVDYDAMDPFKRAAQLEARQTAHHLERFGYEEVEWSRGESCYLIKTPWGYLAHVEEGLGTKNIVAEDMSYLCPARTYAYFDAVAQDPVGMIVNDMITVGALPVSVAMHLAVGDPKWFDDAERMQGIVHGWRYACEISGAAWAGGETPTLRDVVFPETMVLSGSAVGIVTPKERLIKPAIQDGDAIVLVASSGIHANGLTMARQIANKLPDGYLTRLSDGITYGDALLVPTQLYVTMMKTYLTQGVDMHYVVNITGHGWRKLMRAKDPFVYVIDAPGEVPSLFQFMQEYGPISDKEAYGNFNMGAGFALYVPPHEVQRVIGLAAACGIAAWHAGHVEKRGDEKRVVIPSKGIEFAAESMTIR